MDGPKAAVRLNANGDVVYGCDRGLRLLHIQDIFLFKSERWLLVQWEGYELLETVPAHKMKGKYMGDIIEYYKRLAASKRQAINLNIPNLPNNNNNNNK